MTTKNLDKFSSIEDDDDYKELYGFIHWLAWRECNSCNVMLEYEDLVQELFVELIKGLDYYSSMPKEQRKAVIRKMIDNRIGELKYKYYRTHRSAENVVLSLSDDTADYIPSDDNVEELILSKEKVSELRSKLSPFATKVLDALLYKNPRMKAVMELSRKRYEGHIPTRGRQNVKMWYIPQPYHVADVLGESVDAVKSAFIEIGRIWEECNGSAC